jgi:predicted Zn finger-like uncharacterized protein
VKFLCDQCKAKYQIADEKAAGKTVRMKCRRCGHLIEVRATVTEANAGSAPPPAHPSGAPGASPHAPQAPAAGQALSPHRAALPAASPLAPSPPRAAAAPLATSLASAKPPAREKPGALAGAFKNTVQRDEETSAPIDMSDLSPNDEWYVAINGVPVGPIRIAEIRRKAALGGVTEESLAWQEGLDEWRPVRHFPELAAIVREAISGGRGSLIPAPPPRVSAPPPPPRAAGGPRPATGGIATPAPPRAPVLARPPTAPAAALMAPAAAARSNVVPITSRLATAERIEPAGPTVVADPFGSAPAPVAAAALVAPVQERVAVASPMSLAAPIAQPIDFRGKKAPPWIAIGMVAGFIAFGVTAAITIFRPAPQPAPPVVVQVPAAAVPAAAVIAPAAAASGTEGPQPIAAAAPTKPTLAAAGPRVAAATPVNTAAAAPAAKGPLDLHSLTQSQNNVVPTDEGAGDAPRVPGQCFSSGQVQQFVSTHQAAIQRTCWERNPSNRLASNVSVTLTVDPDGSVQGVSATGDDPAIAKCIENEVGRWRFPGMGCSQRMNIPFHFVRQ